MCTVHHAKARDGQSFVIASVTLLTPRPRRAPPPGALAAFEAGPQGARGRGLWPRAPRGPPSGGPGAPPGGPGGPPLGGPGGPGGRAPRGGPYQNRTPGACGREAVPGLKSSLTRPGTVSAPMAKKCPLFRPGDLLSDRNTHPNHLPIVDFGRDACSTLPSPPPPSQVGIQEVRARACQGTPETEKMGAL